MAEKRYQFEDTEATRERILLRAAFCGPPGSGKTLDAIMLGSRMVERMGLAGGLYVIDSEHRSALRYALSQRSGSGYRFRHVPMPEDDFSPAAYTAALEHCERKGASVVVIDSLSHAWNGINGVLEQVDRRTDQSRSKNAFSTGWKDMTPVHARFIERIMQSSAHVIFTMRSKQEWVVEKNDQGKTEPRKLGLAPVQRDGVEYEPDLFFELEAPVKGSNVLMVTKSRAIDIDGLVPGTRHVNPGTEFADLVIAWIEDGETDPPAKEPEAVADDASIAQSLETAVQAALAAPSKEARGHIRDALMKWCQDNKVPSEKAATVRAEFMAKLKAAAQPQTATAGSASFGPIMSDEERLRAIDEARA